MTYPSPRRTSRTVAGVSSVPSILIEPVSGRIRPIISRNSVDFPQPLGPIRTVVRPGAIARSSVGRTTWPRTTSRPPQLDHACDLVGSGPFHESIVRSLAPSVTNALSLEITASIMNWAVPALPRTPNPIRNPSLPDMIPVIYHPKYNITAFGLERLHPFDGLKYRRIYDALIADGIRKPAISPAVAGPPRGAQRGPHTGVPRSLRKSSVLAEILSVPLLARLPALFIDWRVLADAICEGGHDPGLPAWPSIAASRSTWAAATTTRPARGRRILRLRRHPARRRDAPRRGSDRARSSSSTSTPIRGTAPPRHPPWPWASILDVFEEDLSRPQAARGFPDPDPGRPWQAPTTWRSSTRRSPHALDAVTPTW